jgi:predicted outer membrane repeat protein
MRPTLLLAAIWTLSACKPDANTACEPQIWFADADRDGFGYSESPKEACEQPDGYLDSAGDCDDRDPEINPDATEDCADLVDQNCDGVLLRADRDGDGATECADCDDDDPSVHPGAEEVCNDLDDDCDGAIDEDVADAPLWYPDDDRDGYGVIDGAIAACEPPEGFVDRWDDCDDARDDIHPDAEESDCTDPTDYNCDGSVAYADADKDGFAACEDCDDTNRDIYPDAREVCNDVDDDCDTRIDEPGADGESAYYADDDSDLYGAGPAVWACDDPGDGFARTDDDCDDADERYHPGAPEFCDDPADYNCDGSITYTDADGDGFAACEDCNDSDAAISPAADEVCNGLDDDCDVLIDEGSGDGASEWFLDRDGDGYGDPDASVLACEAPDGYVGPTGDCDDSDPAYHPGAPEFCDDDHDYDCDGSVAYADADADGWAACLECDDSDPRIRPDGTEICNAVDDDCDGAVDEDAADALTWYADADGDGYGDPDAPIEACTRPSGAVADASDCNDDDRAVHPTAPEVCNGVDDDCDGTVDEGAIDASTWYADADADGYGDADDTVEACSEPSGYIDVSGDCDDASGAVHPGADEVCNGVDDDCDGTVDRDATDAPTWYADTDGDGFGDAATALEACEAPSGYLDDDTDCDDADATAFPGGEEVCDGVDNDCDGAIDDDATDASLWFANADGDGFGDPDSWVYACSAPSGYLADDTDCDDTRAATYPGATEACNGIDDDCDGTVDEGVTSRWFKDGDSDGYGAGTAVEACTAPTGYVPSSDDCDDTRTVVRPGAAEACDGLDNDCDGTVDEGVTTTWYKDADGDGHGGTVSIEACAAPTGYVASSDDCNDAAKTTYPGATELCDGVDNDCDGTVDEGAGTVYYRDADGDGYGSSADTITSCSPVSGYVSSGGDCNDSSTYAYPGATEFCDGLQNDCTASSWSTASEAGLWTEIAADGTRTNKTASYSGRATSPQSVDLPASATMCLGPGTWYFKVSYPLGTATTKLWGPAGYASTIVDAVDTASVLTVGASTTVTVEGITLRNGSSLLGGGVDNGNRLTLKGSRLYSNSTHGKGGGLYGRSGSVTTITDSLIDGNEATGTATGYGGGGLFFEVGSGSAVTSFSLSNTTVSSNTAALNGGGIYVQGSSLSVTKGTLSDGSTVSGNTATGQGGGLYLTAGNVTCTGSTASTGVGFVNNKATTGSTATGGGGVYLTGNAANKFYAVNCDFGTGTADDNVSTSSATANDLNVTTGTVKTYGDDANVTCASTGSGAATCTGS